VGVILGCAARICGLCAFVVVVSPLGLTAKNVKFGATGGRRVGARGLQGRMGTAAFGYSPMIFTSTRLRRRPSNSP
jgi:hypothetical protein